ncbi:MAG: 3-oxoacyl-[acyl-carrier-protein] synthase III C-terminal domain-containing protein [Gemmatimonadaceae bacterium]
MDITSRAPDGLGVTCIRGIAYTYAAESRSVGELAASGALTSDPEMLERFGFGRVNVAVEESPYELACSAATRLLAEQNVDPSSVGLLIYGGTPSTMAFSAHSDAAAGAASLCTADRFRFPATRLQYELGLDHAMVLALDQLACTTLFGAVRIARAMMATEGIDRAVCVASEFFPLEAGRETIFNCTSDAACAVLLDRSAEAGERNRVIGAATITKGYYWDPASMEEEVVASYFPTAVHAIDRTLASAGWSRDDVDWVIPHNVSVRSWDMLMRLARLPNATLWSRNVALRGHTLAGDNFINLRDAICEGAVRPGDRALLFAYGYGAHWTGLAVEV